VAVSDAGADGLLCGNLRSCNFCVCKEGNLIDEYIAVLNSHAKNVHQHSNALRAMLDGDLLEMVERRMQESRERMTLARKRYIAHIREHGCDSVL
jgi:hypothetical protein